jgi:lipopolysaccharide export system protein LptA
MKFWLIGFSLLAIATAHAQGQAGDPAVSGAPTPIQITATQGIEWRQTDQEVIATGNAKAVRGNVTVQADRLIAHYRKKASATPAAGTPAVPAPASDPESVLNNGNSEIYELEAIGNVHISTPTDNAFGDHAVYNMDDAVLVLTGQHLKLTTPHDVITAKDSIEYYSVKRQAIARGEALIVADDGRSIAADTIIGYLAPPPVGKTAPVPSAKSDKTPDMLGQAGKLQKVDAIGHVVIRTPNQTATGNSGVYLPDPDVARLGGNVHIISGPNQLNGSDALVNMRTGVATLLAAPGGQVAGTVTPSSAPPASK